MTKSEIKQAQSVIAISLLLEYHDFLDWREISTEKTYTTTPGFQVSSVSWWSKALFLDSLLASSFPTAFASFSYFTALARKSKYGTFDLVRHYTV